MKIMTLNIWGGHVKNPLLDFIKSYQDVDVFCLQEVYHNATHKISDEEKENTLNIFSQLHALLPHHHAFFRPVVANIYGIGMFVKKQHKVLNEGEVFIHENPHYPGLGPTHSRNLQWVEILSDNKRVTVFNVHGLWNGKGKTDSDARKLQSQKIRTFVDSIHGPKILCGDFNLRPDTESIRILEHNMTNLVTQYGIKSTRTTFYPKEEKFADYIFTCPEVVVQTFQVLPEEVSDHAPLLLEIE